MAQGKLKVKAKLPASAKSKGNTKNKKGLPIQRRGNAPIKPKKTKFEEAHKLKKIISKTVNKSMEEELRQRALDGKMSLIKKDKDSSTSQKK